MEEGYEMDFEVSRNKHKYTLPNIHTAVRNSDFSSVCEFLEKKGLDVNTRDSDNNTPLHVSAECENLDILNMLLSKGALVNVHNNREETPLHKAAISTMSELVESLLKSGGSVNMYNKDGYTPFHIAVSKGYKKVLELMLDWGACVHSKAVNRNTPLHIAATHWNCILAEILLARGANVNARNCKGKTPLHLAVSHVDMTMTELLLERGADVNAPDFEGQTPLHLAANHWNCRIVKMLLDRRAFVNCPNNKGQTMLHIAVNNGDLTLVTTLLARGALTDPLDNQGLTPLQYAVKNDYSKLMLKLICNGADLGVFTADRCNSLDLQNSPCSGPLLMIHLAMVQWSQPDELHHIQKNYETSNLKDCLQELEKMKCKRVIDMSGNEYSLINVLDKHRHFDLTTCALFEVMFNSINLDTEFPLYSFLLQMSFERMKRRHALIQVAHTFFMVHNFFDSSKGNPRRVLPSSVRQNILSRLNYVDLQNLIVVSEITCRIVYSSWD